ncbi:hypothetical protein C1H46_018751 [Malus baccata]|uniref:Retrotransposon Copia-like N-terminal domain-containing protein n=1 Tax=Malus baccata TaxID=106549 RepID=A0A540MA26_MALBA|nr:hypothetical protein C1H46_018751 [Malus baccata]
MVTASQLQILQSSITGLISSVSSSVSVKLDDSNYLQWHFQMQLLLESYGIMGFVNGSTCCPSQFSSISSSDSEASSMGVGSRIESDDYKAWKMHDYALMLLLTATLSSSAISYVIGSTSSREMWVRLQNHFFLPSTKTSIIKLQTYLYNMTKGSDSISQFLRRIKEARDGLSVLGVTLADEDFVLIALNGLPAKYNTFKCVIRGREGVISLENFRQQLLAEEAIVDCASVTKFGDCQTQEDEMFLYAAKDQVFECIDNEGTKSQLISMGLQPCIQVTFPVLNSDNKTTISVPAQIVALAYEFRRFYVFQLCNGGRIFDIQLGYHMRICDKGGGTRSTLIWHKETLVLIWQKESLVLIWLLW